MHEFWQKIDWSSVAQKVVHYGIRLAIALLILVVGFWVAARVANFGRRAMTRSGIDDLLVSFLRNALYGGLIAMVLVAVLQQAGIPSASFIAALGAAGLAIGLALQGSLSNLAWGVLLIILRPFRIGDFVQLGTQLGTVERIDLMQTHLAMPDGRELIMPNAKVGSDVIINFNTLGTRRFEFNIAIGAGDDIGHAMQIVSDLLAADPCILAKPEPGVWMSDMVEGRINLVIRGWVTAADLWEVQTAFIRSLKDHLDAAGIRVPFPQRAIQWVGTAPTESGGPASSP